MNIAFQPTVEELHEFLSVFEVLERFEAEQRFVAFKPDSLPRPAVVKTIAWLRFLADRRTHENSTS